MAVPVIASSGTILDSDSNSTSVTLAAPASISTDDLLVAVFGHDDANDSVSAAPSGWTLAESGNSQTSGGASYVYWKKAVLADETATDYTWTLNNGESRIGRIYRITGADTTTPINVSADLGSSTTLSTVDYPSITTTEDDCLILAIASPNGTALTTEDDAGNYISGYTGDFSRNATGFCLVVQTAELATAGATGAKTSTIKNSQHFNTMQVAIAPAAASGGTDISVTTGAVTVAAVSGSISQAKNVAATTGAVTVAGTNAAITQSSIVSATTGAVVVAGVNAVVDQQTAGSTSIAVTTGAVVVSGTAAVINQVTNLGITTGAITVAGVNASVSTSAEIVVGVGAVTVAGVNASVVAPTVVNVTTGAISVTGTNASIGGLIWTDVSPPSTSWTSVGSTSTIWTEV